jgi:hypothetical protein
MRRRLPVSWTEKIDASIIWLLNEANFGFCGRQQDVTIMRTTCTALEEALRAQPNICLPDLPESFFTDLLYRKGDTDDYKQRLPPEFHEFIDMA